MKILRALPLAVATAALLLMARGAQAQQQFRPAYLTFSGGAYFPEGSDLDDNDSDTGTAFFLNSGYMMTPHAGVQFDAGYFETTGENSLQVSAIPLTLSLRLAVPIGFVEPYVLGGAGVYFTQTTVNMPGFFIDESGTEFGPHAAAGVDFTFGGLVVGFEARHIWLEASDLNIDGTLFMGKIGTRF